MSSVSELEPEGFLVDGLRVGAFEHPGHAATRFVVQLGPTDEDGYLVTTISWRDLLDNADDADFVANHIRAVVSNPERVVHWKPGIGPRILKERPQ